MKHIAVGMVLTTIVFNSVGFARTSFAVDKSRESLHGPRLQNFSWNVSGLSETAGSDYSCSQICPTDYEPVCASDGVTYANHCAFHIARCKTTDLTLSAAGECAGGSLPDEVNAGSAAALCPDACRDVYDPVSDETGKIYSNKCSMRRAKCRDTKKDVDTLVKYTRLFWRLFGPLRANSTDDNTTGEDSGSSSTAITTSVKDQKSTNITESIETLTTRQTDSVSASGIGSHYDDGIIGSGTLAPVLKCTGACRDIYSPVCGSDGVSYSNPCQLELAACKNPKLQIVQTREDVCPDAAATTAQQETVIGKKRPSPRRSLR